MLKPRKCIRCASETVDRYDLFTDKKIPICKDCQSLIRWEILKEKKRQSLMKARARRWVSETDENSL
ncbi:hypothetical protein C4565_00320 [Candidatus Parcubacteria bacterium]|nr:MAG: hypothetical protein C4565_00320 [Candidatus Parcubacteria bacterium]